MSTLLCDLFYYSSSTVYTDAMFEDMFKHDSLQFIRILFYLRRHGDNNKLLGRKIIGRGERDIFYQVIIWMSFNHLQDLIKIMNLIPDCGYWKDLLVLMGTPAESAVVNMFACQLIQDSLSFNSDVPGYISLAAKWTPNEGSSSDRKHKTFSKIANIIGVTRKELRKNFLVPLRKYLGVTEQIITERKWQTINYNTMPRLCMKLHSKTFERNDRNRFFEHINREYIDHLKKLSLPGSVDNILFDKNIRMNYTNSNDSMIFAIDPSGSMSGFPILLASCLCIESGSSHWIPFQFDTDDKQSLPDAIPITGMSLDEKIDPIIKYRGVSYNMETCMSVAMSMGKKHLIILSDELLDDSEFTTKRPIHITYWSINSNHPLIIDNDKLTIIEGYDINIYIEMQKGIILNRALYKELLLSSLKDHNIDNILSNKLYPI
jgi:hypothetical protein